MVIMNIFAMYYQEYIIEREGEYPTLVYHSVVSLDRRRDLYNVIHSVEFHCLYNLTVTWLPNAPAQNSTRMNNIIKVMSPVKAYYTVVYWSRILSLPLYYILLVLHIWNIRAIPTYRYICISYCMSSSATRRLLARHYRANNLRVARE